MSETVFKQVDLRYLVNALAQEQTHAGISTFELGLGLDTDGKGNKAERAKTILRNVFSRPNADEVIVQMLNYIYVEDAYANTSSTNSVYATLKANVLDPRGVVLTEDGFIFPGLSARGAAQGADQAPGDRARETRDAAATHRTPHDRVAELGSVPVFDIDNRKVFVVHGRDRRPVDAIAQFLQFIHLEMMAWSDAVARTGQSQPHTYDIVKAGMESCAAVIVLFSPDDLAHSKDEFIEEGELDTLPQGQARQNVLLEAGMAFAMARERTVFVRSGLTREISDIAGFNWVKLDGAWDSRKDLRDRLQRAGAAVRKGDYDLRDHLAGPFEVLSN